jgi:acetate kinase
MTLLTVNTGSSSVRLAAFTSRSERIADAHYSGHTDKSPAMQLRAFLQEHDLHDITLVVHRVVHGGTTLTRHSIIDAKVEMAIERLNPLAPLHNPRALAWIRACRKLMGSAVQQIAVFDTAFYADLPEVAATYALPHAFCEQHDLYRYGFHGLAHQTMWEYWRERNPGHLNGRVISLQLGAGCSATAVVNGEPRDTSMGFSPLEGLMMATRCGDLDPGLLLYLQKAGHLDVHALEELLNEASGLLGVSGISGDMRILLESDDPNAALAVDLYCYRARKYIGAYLAALGGADAILFGGGVGENAPLIREKILQDMQWCGIGLDPDKNRQAGSAGGRIDAGSGGVQVWVAPVNEDLLLARAGFQILSETKGFHNA